MNIHNNSSKPNAQVANKKQRQHLLLAVCTALMAVIASVTGLNVAQPMLVNQLYATQSEVLWMINIYAITLAALLLPLGAAGDKWGRKLMLYTGLAIFGIANLLAAFSMSTIHMFVARFFCGVGAAMIMPVTLSVITTTFPDQERSKAIGIWTAVAGAGGIFGMFLSAILVDTVGWRWLFALPILLVIFAAVVGLNSVPNTKDNSNHPFDFYGVALSIITVIGMVTFLHEGPERGWLDSITLVGLAASIIGGFGFVTVEKHHPYPLLDFKFFTKPSLTSGSLTILVWFGVQAGVFIVLYPFFQSVLGWSGLLATLALMPMAILMMLSSAFAPKLVALLGIKLTIIAGIMLGTFGLALMAMLVSVDNGYFSILPGMICMGLGMGLSMTPSTEAITLSLPQEKQGVASALNDVTRELGGSLGVALLGAVFATGYSIAAAKELDKLSISESQALQQGIAAAQALVDKTEGGIIYRVAQESFVSGWQQAMWAGVITLILLLLYVLIRGPENKPRR